MKRFATILAAAAGAALLVFGLQSCGILGGPPGNVQVGAAPESDSTVIVTWTAPAEGTPDSYLVWFRQLGDSNYVQFAETSATSCVHDPNGMTGWYKVAAKFGADVYESEQTVTTVPVHESTRVVAELDGVGNAGYGWDRDAGTGRTYSMRDSANTAHVDFYITDFATGSSRMPYCIASPSMGPADPAGVVPSGNWALVGITDTLPAGNAPLPSVDSTHYFEWSPINRVPGRFGWYSVADDRFALIQVTRVDASQAVVELETWYQLVAGLRLVAHE